VHLLGIAFYAAVAAYTHITGTAVLWSVMGQGAAIPVPPIKGGDAWL
jgi:hypothetical protein